VTSIFAFVFVLGILVFVHELGHFLAARRIGVRVLTFSLGFGPKLFGFRRGDTEYCVSAIPLGGYVKMAGENPDEARTGAPDEFLSKTKWQRFQVLIMGPLMNLALAFVVMAIVLYQGAQAPAFDREPVVVGSVESGSVAASAGIQKGDRIFHIDGQPIANWEQYSMAVLPKANRQITVGIERGTERFDRILTPKAEGKFDAGQLGVLPMMRPQVTAINHDEPGYQGGLRVNDVIVGAAGEHGISQQRVIELIRAHENTPLALEIERDGRPQVITVVPKKVGEYARIGATISPYEVRSIEPTLIGAFKMSADRNWEWTRLIIKTLAGLFTRDTSVKQLMGPVAIAGLSGEAAEQGWLQLFGLMAMISLNLGLLNLMPVPVLDGGHIAILAMEGLSRRDFSMKVKEKMLLAGFVLLVTLMVTVIYNDLARIEWVGRLMPWR
jgi:regulator of sigma E protease